MVTPGYFRRYALSRTWGGTWGGNLLHAVGRPSKKCEEVATRWFPIDIYIADAFVYSKIWEKVRWLLKNESWRMLKGPTDWWAWCWDLHFVGVKKMCMWSKTQETLIFNRKTWKAHTHTHKVLDSSRFSNLDPVFFKAFLSDTKVNELYCENPFNSHSWLLHPWLKSDSMPLIQVIPIPDTMRTKGGHE